VKKGTRTIHRQCACGCGELVQPYIYPRTGRVASYPKFIPGHGRKDWGRRQSKRDPMSHPSAKPIGSSRLHDTGNGLIYRLVKTTPRGRWKYEHRVVMERIIGRSLKPYEHVHHKNEDTLDNRQENLQVMVNVDHVKHHNTISGWSISFAACTQCGTTTRSHYGHGLCTACGQKTEKIRAYHREQEKARRARLRG
jgi:HNH endonuclease